MVSINFELPLNRQNVRPCAMGGDKSRAAPSPTFLDPLCSHPIIGNLPPLTHISNTQPEYPADISDQSRLLHANLVI